MPPSDDPKTAPKNASDPTDLARDWITVWQSEITALAADPEAAETVARLAALWAQAANAMLRPFPAPPLPGHDPVAPVRPGADAPPGPAPTAAAPDAGHDALRHVLERLDTRLGALEQRLAELEARGERRRRAGPRRKRG